LYTEISRRINHADGRLIRPFDRGKLHHFSFGIFGKLLDEENRLEGDHDMVGSPERPSGLFFQRVDDELLLRGKDEVLDGHEIRMREIEAFGHELDLLVLPFKVNAIKGHAAFLQ
jgi:hypothetical protein